MSEKHQDRILEAALEEVLNQQTPPDVTLRVLSRLAGGHGSSNGHHANGNGSSNGVFNGLNGHAEKDRTTQKSEPLPPPVAPPPFPAQFQAALHGVVIDPHGHSHAQDQYADPQAPLPPPIFELELAANESAETTFEAAPVLGPPRVARRSSPWTAFAATAASLLIICGAGALAYQLRDGNSGGNQLADTGEDTKPPHHDRDHPPAEHVADNHASPDPSDIGNSGNSNANPKPPSHFPHVPPTVASDDEKTPFQVVKRAPIPAKSDVEIIADVDKQITQRWAANQISPAEPADDAEWFRRTYLRLLGRIPSVEELEDFLADKDAQKRDVVVANILGQDPKLLDEFALNWAAVWTNSLLGRSEGRDGSGPANRAALEQYLYKAFKEDRPYSEVAKELISATGSADPSQPDFNPAVNFLIAAAEENEATLATVRTSQAFMGKRIQCTQCHNHIQNEWSQHHFWELNAFFRQMDMEGRGQKARLVDRDFASDGDLEDAGVFYQRLNGIVKVAYPSFPGAGDLPKTGDVSEFNRRKVLAELIVQSDDLPRATVNRVWSLIYGYGFTKPVDDMGPHNQPSHPEVLDELADQFVAHDFKMRSLVGWVVSTKPFQLSSRVPKRDLTEQYVDDPQSGQPLFSHYYTRQMEPEEVYQSLLLVSGEKPGLQDYALSAQTRNDFMNQFTKDMDTDDGLEVNQFDGSIHQSLMIMNGPLMDRAIDIGEGTILGKVIRSELKPRQKIEHLFLAALARKPSRRELDLAEKIYVSRGSNTSSALQDIWWSLLNSNEFILDH